MSQIRPTPCGKYFFKVFLFAFVAVTILSLLYFVRSLRHEEVAKPHRRISNSLTPNYQRKVMAQFQGEKIVHLDLKGAPPKLSYLKELFPLIAKLGATGLLIEYEDMFPFSGSVLQNVSAFNAYSLGDIRRINEFAKKSNLKVIPLVQTFGHMEFILKLERYREFREMEIYPSAICPSHDEVLDLLGDMIKQVLLAHPESEMLHIGSDEVFFLGMCDKCRNVMSSKNYSKKLLFMDHINSVVSLIESQYPHVRILMWDDEFRTVNAQEMRQINLSKRIEPVVWKYTKEVSDDLGPSLWDFYGRSFPKVWIASAFKGATGSKQYVVDSNHYLENHRSWMSLYNDYRNRIHFEGIIITGWQRYDHFAVLCELLPAGIPSLAMSLRIVLGYQDSPLTPPREVSQILKCEQPYALMGSAFGTPHCSYPGGNVLENVLRLQMLQQEFDGLLEDSRSKGWVDQYNIAHEFSSPQYVEFLTAPLVRIRVDLASLEKDMTTAMQEVYDNYTIDEWKETYLKPFAGKVEKLWDAKQKLLSKNQWPRRPLTYKNDKEEL